MRRGRHDGAPFPPPQGWEALGTLPQRLVERGPRHIRSIPRSDPIQEYPRPSGPCLWGVYLSYSLKKARMRTHKLR
jgi:hypothetical protein